MSRFFLSKVKSKGRPKTPEIPPQVACLDALQKRRKGGFYWLCKYDNKSCRNMFEYTCYKRRDTIEEAPK